MRISDEGWACDRCEKEITPEEYRNEGLVHTPRLEVYHADCCPDCEDVTITFPRSNWNILLELIALTEDIDPDERATIRQLKEGVNGNGNG